MYRLISRKTNQGNIFDEFKHDFLLKKKYTFFLKVSNFENWTLFINYYPYLEIQYIIVIVYSSILFSMVETLSLTIL